MTALTKTAANISASEERGAILRRFTANESMTPGDVVYLDSNNKVNKAKADSAAHARAIGIVVIPDNFYGESTIASGGTATVCVFGPVWGWNVSNSTYMISGLPVWVDKTTAGILNDTAPTGGAYQFQVGHMLGNDTIFVDPGTTSPSSAA